MKDVFEGKVFGSVAVGQRGQFVIPAKIREAYDIKPGDKLILFSSLERKLISIMPVADFNDFLDHVSERISTIKHVKKEKVEE